MMKNKPLVLAMLALLVTPAFAGDFYAGIDLGRGKTEFKEDGIKFGKSANSAGIFGGYRFNEYFAAELGYQDLGKTEFKPDAKNQWMLKSKAVQTSALGILPISPDFELFGRMGFARVKNSDNGLDDGVKYSDSGSKNVSVVGLGARYALNKNFGIRSEYKQYAKIDGVALSNFSVGADIRF